MKQHNWLKSRSSIRCFTVFSDRPATSVAVAPGKVPPGPVAVQLAARGCARDRWGPSPGVPLGGPAFDPWPWLLKPPCLMMISRF